MTLLVVAIYLTVFVSRGHKKETAGAPVRPISFLLFTVGSSFLAIFFLPLVDIQYPELAFALAMGCFVGILHPVAAVSFLVSALIVRPWEVPPFRAEEGMVGNAFMGLNVKILACVCVGSWIIQCWKSGRLQFVWNWYCSFFVLFLSWLLVDVLLSPDPQLSWDLLFQSFFPVVVLSFILTNAFEQKRDLEAFKGAVVISIVGAVLAAISFTMVTLSSDPRLRGDGILFANSNDIGALIAIAIPWTAQLFAKTPEGKRKILRGTFAMGVLLYGLWMTQSRGTILSLLMCIGAYYVLCRKISWARLAVLAMMMVVPFVLMSLIKRNEDDLEISKTARQNYIVAGMNMVIRNPVFGVGLGRYPKEFDNYTPSFEEYGERTAHNSWILVMAESGILGLFLFATVYLGAIKMAWPMRIVWPEYFLVLVSYGVCMSFLSHTYNFLPYLLAFVTLAATRVLKKEKQRAEIASP